MPVPVINFRKLDADESSPFGGSIARAIEMKLKEAEAQSKAAYSNLVGPQFMAKIFEHPELLANVPEGQKQPTLDWLRASAMGAGNNSSLSGGGATGSGKTIGQRIAETFFGGTSEPSNGAAASPPSAAMTMPSQQKNVEYNPPPNATQQQLNDEEAGRPGSSVTKTDEQVRAEQGAVSQPKKTFAETAGAYEGTVAGGKARLEEQGRAGGKQLAEYGDTWSDLNIQNKAVNSLVKSLNTPVLSKIANTPFINQKSVKWYEQTGTPEEKKEIGLFKNKLTEVAASAFNMFKGKVTDRDLAFVDNMKGSPDDLIDTLKGKAEGLQLFTQTKMKQIELAHEYMKRGMDKLEAEKKASQEVDTDSIEDMINAKVFPPPVQVRTPKGIISLPKQGAMQLMRDHPENHEIIEAGTA